MTEPLVDAATAPGRHLPGVSADATAGPVAVQVRRQVWGRRRLVVGAALAPGLLWLLVQAGGGWTPAAMPGWVALLAVVAVVGGLTLASYVPARGESWRDTLGCSPCAAVSGGTVLAAAFLVGQAPHQVGMALPALAVVLFGLVQRTSSTRDACVR
ncbi:MULTISPECIES: hypothetical protein [Oerskovia]|uniref:Integral membrane protein n=1 Tax=Oerskovia merdavium TaxID=2762227 RepID=A0ABR8U197_9CELL|nr:hypothetical protein [Oerskovia merdavium]MBD7981525.1 hypothetical protein [Oerskovia merdavium]